MKDKNVKIIIKGIKKLEKNKKGNIFPKINP